MGIIVIVAYRPREGKEADLEQLLREHIVILRGENLATDRPPIVMRAKDGTYVEVFEWKSEDAIHAAHSNPVVGEMWGRFDAACTFEAVGNLEESKTLFSSFIPVD